LKESDLRVVQDDRHIQRFFSGSGHISATRGHIGSSVCGMSRKQIACHSCEILAHAMTLRTEWMTLEIPGLRDHIENRIDE